MTAGFAHADRCDARWFFVDFGISHGMREAEKRARDLGQMVRTIRLEYEGNWLSYDIPDSVIDALYYVMIDNPQFRKTSNEPK
jgi:hypothetical protein